MAEQATTTPGAKPAVAVAPSASSAAAPAPAPTKPVFKTEDVLRSLVEVALLGGTGQVALDFYKSTNKD